VHSFNFAIKFIINRLDITDARLAFYFLLFENNLH